MPISFVAAGAVSTGANPTVAVPAGYTTNDLLLLITSGTAAPTIPSGWTQVSAEGANRFITVLYKFASSSESSVSLTLAGTTSVAVMLAYRGAGAYEIVPAYTTGSSTTATPNTLTTTVANDYVINVYANLAGAARTLTANASTTSRANSSTTLTENGLLIADELRVSTGVTTARAATISASSAWSAIAIGFMPARNVYWVGGSGAWTPTNTTNWSLTSGGAGNTRVPTIIDSVFFDANSGTDGAFNISFDGSLGAVNCASLDTTGAIVNIDNGYNASFGFAPTINCAGSFTLTNKTSWFNEVNQLGANIVFSGTGTITTGGCFIHGNIEINGVGITVTLGDSLFLSTQSGTDANKITVTQGTFNTNGKAVRCNQFLSSNSNTRGITLGTSTILITNGTNSVTPWNLATTTNLTFSGASSTISITGASNITFAGGGLTYGRLVAAGNFTLTGANTFSELIIIPNSTTFTFPAGVTTTLGLFVNNGAGVSIQSSSAGSAATISYTGAGKCSLGTGVSSVKDINFSSANTFYVGAGAANGGNNTNVNFSTYILYWVGGNGTWDSSSTTRWSLSSGGSGGAGVPDANVPVVVNGSSGSPTITLSGTIACASLDTTGATCTFTSTGALSVYGSLTLTSSTTWSASATLTLKGHGGISFGSTANPTTRGTGCLLTCPLEINAPGCTYGIGTTTPSNTQLTVQNTLTLTAGAIGHGDGTINKAIECTTFVSNNSNYRQIYGPTSGAFYIITTDNNKTVCTLTNNDGIFTSGNAFIASFYTGSVGTRTFDFGTNLRSRFLNLRILGGTDTATFAANNTLPAITTAAISISSISYAAFTGTYSHSSTFLVTSSITIGAGTTFTSSGDFNLTNLYSLTATITPSLGATNININGVNYRNSGSLVIAGPTTTTGVISKYGPVTFTTSGTVSTGSFVMYRGNHSGTITITGNNATVLDVKNTASSVGTCNLTYSGSTGTRTINTLVSAGVNITAGTDTVTFTNNSATSTLNFTGFSGTFSGSGNLSTRNLTFSTGMTQSYSGSLTFVGFGFGGSVRSNGKSFTGSVTFGGGYDELFELLDAFSSSNTVLVQSYSSFRTNNNSLTCTTFSTGAGNASQGALTLGSSTITLTGTGTVWTSGFVASRINAGTSTIVLSNTSATARTFAGIGATYYNLVIGGTTGSSTTTITGANTFNQISSTKTVAHTLSFAADQTVTTWAVTGTAGNLVTINSNTANTARILTITNRTSGIDYLIVRDITSNKTPVTFFAGANSQLQSNVAGVAARTPLPTTEFLYVLDTGTSWTVPANFNSSNNSIHLISGGGGGAGGRASGGTRAGGGGGGGGGYTQVTNVALTPGASISYAVGAAGALGAGGANGGAGGATTFNSGAYTTTGGGGGQATTTSSTGGTAGTGSTFNGGVGGVGSFNASSQGHGGGGGAGAGGPNGAGQNGGNGFASGTAANVAGGGGGGNGGGTAGGNASSATGGTGGNNFGGSGGASSTAVTAFNGGGGAGGVNTTAPGFGSCGVDIYGVGGAGGRGGSPQGAAGTIGLHNYGGGGSGGGVSTTGTTQSGGTGGQGGIVVWYSTISAAAPSTMFMLFR